MLIPESTRHLRPPLRSLALLILVAALSAAAHAQDSSTGVIRGTVADLSGARIAQAVVTVTSARTGVARTAAADAEGAFAMQLLPPDEYVVSATAAGMADARAIVRLEVGGSAQADLVLGITGAKETVNVSGEPNRVETMPSEVSSVVDERAIEQLPINGRRFTDLALLTPGVTQDPRSLTSATNGDLAFGGVRGFQSSFLVDGVDNNNAFFAQARGRYRAPYQFSNEVVQEFRVSSNTYGAELGRAGGAVVNVVTKSGSNYWHGTGFYFLRDGQVNANYRGLDPNPVDRQHQFGGTIGGPIKQNKLFFFAGFDQHIFHVPSVVHFANGATTVVPQPADYEASDQELVYAAANSLSAMGGEFRSMLLGNAGFAKLDWALSPKHYLSARLSTSRYYGENNVFFDPGSPVTTYAMSENGEERVSTESAVVSLTSALSRRITNHLRVQFARDLEDSSTNSAGPQTKIYDVFDGFGRSSILPRTTREHRLQFAETLSLETGRHSWKFGGDFSQIWIYNFFPSLFGGEYIFDNMRVNPFTFEPMTYGLHITPLRAYAHDVPRYYIQNFGDAVSHPDTREYAAFVQDTVRLSRHLALSLGIRYDLQTFNTAGLVSNPLWPASGKVPTDTNNVAPRVGFAWSIGDSNPLVVRGGFGMFYTRIPQIYTSAVATDSGLSQSHLFLDNMDYYQRQVFPSYPNPAVSCATNATQCLAPSALAGYLTSEISAFSPNFQTPYVQQASLSLEREVARRMAVGVNYLYVRGEHLVRALDANLPPPVDVSYPVYDSTGAFTGNYYDVASFATWQFARSVTCAFPPCLNPVQRPIPGIGAINQFESAASSVYHGMTVSVRRRMTNGFYFRAAYTWAHAIDDGPDALVAGRPGNVQNAYAPYLEWGPSVTDQRQRFVVSAIWEPRPFDAAQPAMRSLFNNWRFSSIYTRGTGRPIDGQVIGDGNGDGNTYNDRLPGFGRNAFVGPDYSSTDLRITRAFHIGDHLRLDAIAEAFNLLNRANLRVNISDDGFGSQAASFVPIDKTISFNHFPAYYTTSSNFLVPTDAYAPRQIQFALKLTF